jgi:curved DNA-binding protein CbpA
MNPYEILGVETTATTEDIKAKYKQLANIHHPDKGGDEETFKTINLAYTILSDPIKRQNFDNQGIFFTDLSMYSEAKDVILKLFNEKIHSHDPDHQDLIMLMRVELVNKKRTLENQLEQCNNIIKKMNKVKNKLRLKKKTENIIEDFVDSGLKNCKHDLIVFARGIQIYDYVLVILDNYHYSDFDWAEMLSDQHDMVGAEGFEPTT